MQSGQSAEAGMPAPSPATGTSGGSITTGISSTIPTSKHSMPSSIASPKITQGRGGWGAVQEGVDDAVRRADFTRNWPITTEGDQHTDAAADAGNRR